MTTDLDKGNGRNARQKDISGLKNKKSLMLTLMQTFPSTLCISPRKADNSEDFPEPTVPTKPTSDPCGISIQMFLRVKPRLSSHVNVPFSMDNAGPGSALTNEQNT